jgi:hypothetical protein
LQYYLRQQQGVKNKRSIHDISLEDLEELEDQHGPILTANNVTGNLQNPYKIYHLHAEVFLSGSNSPPPSLPPLPHITSTPQDPTDNSNTSDISHLFTGQPYTSTHTPSSPPSQPQSPPLPVPFSSTTLPTSAANFPSLFSSSSSSSSSLSNTLPGMILSLLLSYMTVLMLFFKHC